MKKIIRSKLVNVISILFIVCFFTKQAILHLPIFENVRTSVVFISYSSIGVLINIAIAIWLFNDAKKRNQNSVIWALLALFFGLIALFTYYWRLIYIKISQNEIKS